ncbi:MAG: RNA 2',3'-cyclic phosphodiesterase [Patescibacteria group bacterium]
MPRTFLAINLPVETKDLLANKQKDIRLNFDRNPLKWVKRDNLHITLAFLGSVDKEKIKKLSEDLKSIDFFKFSILIDDVRYVPNRREAKMIWATGQSEDVEKLKKEIDQVLINADYLKYTPDSRDFKLHVTLARTRSFEFKKQSIEQIPLLEDEFVNSEFEVSSFEIMESKLSKGGPQYKIIKSFNL